MPIVTNTTVTGIFESAMRSWNSFALLTREDWGQLGRRRGIYTYLVMSPIRIHASQLSLRQVLARSFPDTHTLNADVLLTSSKPG